MSTLLEKKKCQQHEFNSEILRSLGKKRMTNMRKMKDSGIEWIGKIPINWICCKQKYELTLINGRAFSDSEFEVDGKYRILRVGNLFSNPVWYTSNLELEPDKYCQNGDLLYSWSMSYAPVIWTGEKVIYHYHIWKVSLNNNIEKKFAYYYLQSLTSSLKSELHETTMSFITMGIMNNSYMPVPPIKEQYAISNYLNYKCAEIDALTADIETQIEILEEYKQSVITEAVTKGLNPDVEMKDSGIEYIGNIPSNWKSGKLVFYVNDITDVDHYMPNSLDDGIPYIMTGNLQSRLSRINFQECKKISINDFERLSSKCKVQKGDVIFARYATIGTVCYVDVNKNCIISYSCVVINPSERLDGLFLYYYLQSDSFFEDIQRFININTQGNIGIEDLKNSNIVIPPKKEQLAISNYLNDKCTEIDSIIADKQTQLETLTEYKKSLIYEYVTGKKEVPSA